MGHANRRGDRGMVPVLVTNASNFIRGYDPRSGKELWKIGRSSKITAPTPVFSNGLFVVASGRAPERPIYVVRAGARGDLTLPDGATSNEAIAWSRTGRGSYMPTPLIYKGLVYVLANNGVFDAYDLRTGTEIYRHRLPQVGNGFSASPVARRRENLHLERGRRHAGHCRGARIQTHCDELDRRAADGDAGTFEWRHVCAIVGASLRHRAQEINP